MWNSPAPETPVFNNFLSGLQEIIRARDGAKLQDFLQLEPPLAPIYNQMVDELRQAYPSASGKDERLLAKCESLLPASASTSPWSAFPLFMRLYFTFLRDVNLDNLLETYELLRTLLNQCIVALGDSQYGVILLPTVLYLCKVLAKFAIGLDRRPELIAHLLREGADAEGATEKVTLVEKSANVRVTYLYYLGRYLFSNNLFYPAQTALQSAYDQCHKQAVSQRRLILTYLISCNIILGRFPSMTLLQRPECDGLGERFVPLCQTIARGDVPAFREHLAVDSTNADWFAQKGILLQLRNRCEILVWRSLARKVFIFAGFHGNPNTQSQRGPPPFLYLHKFEAAIQWLESRAKQQRQVAAARKRDSGGELISFPADSDFNDGASNGDNLATDSNCDDYINPAGYFDSSGEWVDVNNPRDLPEPDLHDSHLIDDGSGETFAYIVSTEQDIETTDPEGPSPLMHDLECILASLLNQDLMRGYLTHKNPRYAIPGSRVKGALPTGFPNVWQTIYARENEDDQVPGWVKPPNPFSGRASGASAGMGGRVVNLSGAKPISAMTG
ncbi:COP9 signalosome complex subunit 12 [Coccidioides immitis RMSCC 3703]|uniref:COP9 signalosome complex subunit 12 n=1 Tax=Coccidioides immitis RMSCC 3703 TaxID=454286 RepID=A0A0J8RBM0_COCIT|nr:COP9 signalosome complex subunit 12 [Coccidioides immitis RMSCC 3703]